MQRLFLHLTLLGFLGAGSSCSRDPERLQALTDKLAELEEQGDTLKYEQAAQRKALASISAERERLTMERAKTEDDIRKTVKEIDAIEEGFAKYKLDYRLAIQRRAKGIELGDLTVNGETLKNVVVSSATDTELTVLHANGMARILLAKAPPKIQGMFGFDESTTGASDADVKKQLELAVRLGKKTLEANKQQLEKIEKDAQKAAQSVPSTVSPSSTNEPGWRRFSSFEGSYYAPLKNREAGAAKVNPRSVPVGTGTTQY